MKKINYRYQIDEALVVIEDLQNDESLFLSADQILSEIETEIGPLASKYIILDRRGVWDLLLPRAERLWGLIAIYPLSASTLSEAKEEIRDLVITGQVQGKIP